MFIDFEGIDGSGKTTLSNRVVARLRALGRTVTHARENGVLGSPIAERIRALTRDVNHLSLCESAELLLYAAREAQIVDEVIRPALARGDWIVADRFVYSHLALAREGRGLAHDAAWSVCQFAAQGLMPDLVIFVDVEPAIARFRKRCSKIREGRTGSPSRKGQAGAGLPARVRQGFRALAAEDPSRWVVFDNTWSSLEEAEDALVQLILERAAGAPAAPRARNTLARPYAALGVPRDAAQVRAGLLSAVDAISRREPALAAYLLGGLSGGDVDERRMRLALFAPAIVARGLTGVAGEGAMALRHALKAIEPQQVALSLNRVHDEDAWRLRLELAPRAPGEVARSLALLPDANAMELRVQLARVAPAEVLGSLAFDDSAEAWALRDELGKSGGAEALARSVTGLDSERAWRVREALLERAPLAALESLERLAGDRAKALRERHVHRAPRAVLATLAGLDDDHAWSLREAWGERMREALLSTIGLRGPRAWVLRERLARVWPGACVKSLVGLVDSAEARRLVFELLAEAPDDLERLKSAAYVLDPGPAGLRSAERTSTRAIAAAAQPAAV